MKLSLPSLFLALAAVLLVSLPAGTEATFFSDLRSRLSALEDAHSETMRSVARSPQGSSIHPALRSSAGFPAFANMGSVRSRGKAGQLIKDLFKKLAKKAAKKLKEKAEEERKQPDIPDPEDILRPQNTNDGESGADRRERIDLRGPYGRESKVPGTSGREIEGAFHGDTGREVKQVESGSDRRDAIERSGSFGREHKVRGSSGRQIEGAVQGGGRGQSGTSSNRRSGSDRNDRRRDRNRGEGRSQRNRGDRGRSIEN